MNFSSEYSDISSVWSSLTVSRGHDGVRAGILNDAERGGGRTESDESEAKKKFDRIWIHARCTARASDGSL